MSPSLSSSDSSLKSKTALGIVITAFALVLYIMVFGQPAVPPPTSYKTNDEGVPVVYDKSRLGTPMPHFPEPIVKWTNFASTSPSGRVYRATEHFPTRLRVLITGGAGFIGSQLGWKLHAL